MWTAVVLPFNCAGSYFHCLTRSEPPEWSKAGPEMILTELTLPVTSMRASC